MCNLAIQSVSRDAKFGAIALALAAFATLLLSHTVSSLAPVRALTAAIAIIAVWAFCDEMGMRKPLNRAGFVFFSIAMTAKFQIVLGVASQPVGHYQLLYAAFLLLAVLLWSMAFLHRQREVKLVGVVGLLAAMAPIASIVVGHLVLGAGAIFGVGSLLTAAEGGSPSDSTFLAVTERIFGLWSYFAAWLLWRGHINGSRIAN
jgi:hypothetical protein